MTKEERYVLEQQLIAAIVEAKKNLEENEKRLSKLKNDYSNSHRSKYSNRNGKF